MIHFKSKLKYLCLLILLYPIPFSHSEILIDQKKFQLFTSGSRAWSFSPSDDEKIINFLKKSMKMKVVGTSSRGTITTDTFSLLGFSKAYKKISEACNKN